MAELRNNGGGGLLYHLIPFNSFFNEMPEIPRNAQKYPEMPIFNGRFGPEGTAAAGWKKRRHLDLKYLVMVRGL